MNKKALVTLVKSKIGSTKRQKETLLAIGLSKLNSSVEKELTPQVEGMLAKVNHLITVKAII